MMSAPAIGGVIKRVRHALDELRHARLVVPVVCERSRRPAVYFLTPDNDRPCGGVRVIYRHVDLLNAAGLDAFVLHQRRGFRCTWFQHSTRILDATSARIGRGDLLVVTEPDVCLLARLPQGTRHAVLSQSVALAWKRAPDYIVRHYRTSPDLAGIVTVSDYTAELLRYAFPRVAVYRVHNGLDPRVFFPGSAPRARRIAYMPRRGDADAQAVINLLRGRGALDDWETLAIDGLNHEGVAAALRSSRIFLSLGYQEGFGLPVAEAMACGNYVVGYHGYGGRELFLRPFSACVPAGDLLAFARALEKAIACDQADPDWCIQRGLQAAETIARRFAPQREEREVVGAYRELLYAAPGAAPGAVREDLVDSRQTFHS